jgi:glycerol-3-phosphate dehydrogenase
VAAVADLAPPVRLTSGVMPLALDRRRRDVERLANERFDVVVVGGGIVGAGVLLDATSRGLRAALVEQDDIAAGTSSRSSRLIHGGLRYLEQYRFRLVAEALAERHRMLRLAPHLVRLEPFLFPVFGVPLVHRSFYGTGMLLYDLLGARDDGGWAGHLSVDQVLDWAPTVRRRGLRGGIVYHDAVEDDARFTLGVVRTATQRGALAVTRARAVGLLERDGRVEGVRVEDREQEGSPAFDLRAAHVVDTTGVWAATDDHPFGPGPRVLPSRGSHIVVRRERIPIAGGMTLRVPGRVVFIIPWASHWIVGTTDAAYVGSPSHPHADGEEVDQLLAAVNRDLHLDLGRSDIVGTYAGLRPLAGREASGRATSRLSREHRIERRSDGLVRVSGGKYTTYRVMARQTVDAALSRDEARRRPSTTARIPIVGALPPVQLRSLADRLGSDGLDARAARTLVARHGSEAETVVALGRDRRLLDRLTVEADHLEAEVVHAVRTELAMSLDDVLARRMRLAVELPDRGASIGARVAQLMAPELGWSVDRQAREVALYLESAELEYGVPGT